MLQRLLARFQPSGKENSKKKDNTCQQLLVDKDGQIGAICAAFHRLLLEQVPCFKMVQEEKQGYSSISNCRQIEIWDCGIACLLMILRWLNPEKSENSPIMTNEEMHIRLDLLAKIDSESIWTADLVLQIHNIFRNKKADYIFCSRTLQVEDDYRDVGYYKSSFKKDQERVTKAFKSLDTLNSSSFCIPHLPLSVLLNATCNPKCVAIVLVDNQILQSESLKTKGNYVGHYVILCGISRENDDVEQSYLLDGLSKSEREEYCLVLSNPGMHSPPTMFISPSRFERSWRSNGTDDDVIFVIRQD